jgi:hypothetical protein
MGNKKKQVMVVVLITAIIEHIKNSPWQGPSTFAFLLLPFALPAKRASRYASRVTRHDGFLLP